MHNFRPKGIAELIVLLSLDSTLLKSHKRPGLAIFFTGFIQLVLTPPAISFIESTATPKRSGIEFRLQPYRTTCLTWPTNILCVVAHEVVPQKRRSKLHGRNLLRKVTLHKYQGHLKLFELTAELWGSKGIIFNYEIFCFC